MSGSTFTWSGATSTAWAPSGNWMPAGPPSSGDTADINPGTPNILTLSATELNNDTINLLNGATLAFDNGATLDGSSTVNGIAGTIDVSGVFTDYGNIAVSSGQTLVVSMAPGATLISNGPNQNGPGTDIGINDGGAGEFNGGALYVLGGTLDNQEVHVNGGYTDVTSALESNDELSLDGGTLEIAQQTTVSPAQITFINADTSVSSVLKLDNPTLFDGDNNGVLYAFKAGDTIVIGQSVARVIYNLDTAINGGTLIAENAAGNPLFTAQLSGGDAPTFASGTFDLDGGTIAGSFQVVSASNGDVLISEPSSPGTTTPPSGPATWNWIGGTGSVRRRQQLDGDLRDQCGGLSGQRRQRDHSRRHGGCLRRLAGPEQLEHPRHVGGRGRAHQRWQSGSQYRPGDTRAFDAFARCHVGGRCGYQRQLHRRSRQHRQRRIADRQWPGER